MLLHLSLRTLLVEMIGRNNVLIDLTDLAKESYRKSLVEDYQTFKFVKGRQFTNWINSKLISELVSSDKSVFLCFNATQV